MADATINENDIKNNGGTNQMIIYLVILVLIYIWGVIFLNKYKNRKYFLTLSFSTMALVLGLRASTVGEDTLHYINIFKISKSLSYSKIVKGVTETVYATQWGVDRKIENGYILLNKLISILTDNEQWIIFIVAGLTCCLFARFIYRNTKHVFFATQVFLCESLYMNSFNLMRQMLAMSIALNAYELLKEKKYKKAIIVFVIAFLFHKSSIVLLVLLPLCAINDYQRTIKYVAFGAIMVNILVPIISKVVSKLIPRYSEYFYVNYWTVDVNGTMILWGIEIALCILIYFKGINDKDTFVAVACTMLYLSLDILGLKISSFSRVALYFRSFLILLFPLFIPYIQKRSKNRLWYQLIIIIILTGAYLSYARTDVRAYQFFWK